MKIIRIASIPALVAACLFSLPACSTTPVPVDLIAAANEAYTAEDWATTEKLYGQLVNQDASSGRYWYRLAIAQRYLGNFDKALASLDKAADVGVPASYTDYERAKVSATQGQNEEAIKLLQSAAEAGLGGKSFVLENEQLAALSGMEGFDAIIEKLENNANPCRTGKFREFDFWIGDWEVKTANDAVAGHNSITAEEKDCVLVEKWKNLSGGSGMSMNFYDVQEAKWVQQWVSPGLQLRILGGMKDGSMVMEGTIHYIQAGNTAPFRGTWTPLEDGRVRQFFEQADEEGTWSPWFEGFYTKMNKEEAE